MCAAVLLLLALPVSAAQDPVDWKEAQERLVRFWGDGLADLPATREHAEFFKAHGRRVLFQDLGPGRSGTYDFKEEAPVVDETFFKEAWTDIQAAGVEPGEAARRLAAKSLPVFAHLVRDGMLRAERKAAGLDYEPGLLEDELLHWWEEAAVYEAVAKKQPGLYGSEPRTWFDGDRQDLAAARAKGPAGIAALVESLYALPSILKWPREKLLARYEDPLKKIEGDIDGFNKYHCRRVKVPAGCHPYSELKSPVTGGDFRTKPEDTAYWGYIREHDALKPAGWTPPPVEPPPAHIWVYVKDLDVEALRKEAAPYRPPVEFLKNDGKYNALRTYFRKRLDENGFKAWPSN